VVAIPYFHYQFLIQSAERWTEGAIKISPEDVDADDHTKELGHDYYGPGYVNLLNLVPFEGEEEALWALRIEEMPCLISSALRIARGKESTHH
jgi:hypothetical protein